MSEGGGGMVGVREGGREPVHKDCEWVNEGEKGSRNTE